MCDNCAVDDLRQLGWFDLQLRGGRDDVAIKVIVELQAKPGGRLALRGALI
jgi:hypothetical protein